MDKIQNMPVFSLPCLNLLPLLLFNQVNSAMENKRLSANTGKIDNLWFSGDNEYINSMLADNDQSQSYKYEPEKCPL